MWLLISGILIPLIGSFLHSYCAIGRQSSDAHRPMIFDSFAGILLQIAWIALFVIGISLLFIANWILGIVGVFVYWFLLPLLVTPIVKKWMLPAWDDLPGDVKDTLGKLGYKKDNYLHGDWWKASQYRKK